MAITRPGPPDPTTAPESTEDLPAVVITLDPDSYECPDCGVIAVPTDTRSPDPRLAHVCRQPVRP